MGTFINPYRFATAAAFTPASLGAKLLAWYDPSDLTTLDKAGPVPVTSDGDAVLNMRDKSSNGNSLGQSTVGSRPLWRAGSGLPYLEFDGSNDCFPVGWISGLAYPWERLTALQQISWTSGDYVWGNATASRPGCLQQGGGGTPNLRLLDGTTTNTLQVAPPTGTNVVVTERHIANASLLAYDNNAYQGPTDCGSVVPGVGVLGAVSTIGGNAGNIRFYGAVICDGTLTAGEIASLRTYLGNKCGLTL